MARKTGWLAALLFVVPSLAVAQDWGSGVTSRPRAELGVGGGMFSDGGSMLWVTKTVQARGSLRLTSGLSVEGLVDFSPETDFRRGVYRIQGQWRIGHYPYQPFLTFGGGGEFSRWPARDYRFIENGEEHVYHRESGSRVDAPMYPTVGLGVEKVLASYLAVRAELGVAFGVNEYGIVTAFLPSVSLCVPIGRYRR